MNRGAVAGFMSGFGATCACAYAGAGAPANPAAVKPWSMHGMQHLTREIGAVDSSITAPGRWRTEAFRRQSSSGGANPGSDDESRSSHFSGSKAAWKQGDRDRDQTGAGMARRTHDASCQGPTPGHPSPRSARARREHPVWIGHGPARARIDGPRRARRCGRRRSFARCARIHPLRGPLSRFSGADATPSRSIPRTSPGVPGHLRR